MESERQSLVEQLVQEALDLEEKDRAEFLERHCAGGQSLRAEVESLLAFGKVAESFMEAPAMEVAARALAVEQTTAVRSLVQDDRQAAKREPMFGRVFGAYRITELLGAGGMGDVYRAFRADDQYKKNVAIKLVRAGQDSRFVVARFKNERQVLASLEHPNIARLLDGGTTDDGIPYFVMELIEGQPLTQYCDERKLATTDRLKLFLQVCSAVQYAHQRLIIHRDLKPSNILVTSDGTPKLLDFGIAKILDQAGAIEKPDTTMSMFRLLTPAYASPEQVKGEAITTATDVYSLGVILYECLTGHRPYPAGAQASYEISRAVCEFEPEKPSMVIRRTETRTAGDQTVETTPMSVSTVRDGTPERLGKRLRGDVDDIVLMALRKEPQRRYVSVVQFAEDIQRHFDNLPVIVRKDTVRYRAAKFFRRNRVAVLAAVVVVATLALEMAITLHEARIAQGRFNDVRQLANSLMFEVYDSIRQVPGTTTARKLIIQRAQEYLDRLAQESKSDATLLRELADAYGRLADVQGSTQEANVGDTPRALANYRRAVELSQEASSLQPSNPEIRRELAQHYLNWSLALGVRAGNKAEYNHTLREAINILETLVASNPQDSKAQATLATAYMQMGGFLRTAGNDLPGALENQKKGLATFERLLKAEPNNEYYQIQIANAHRAIGAVLAMQKQWDPALDQYRAALPMDEAQLSRHPDTVSARWNISIAYSNTGFILVHQGNLDGGLDYYRKALEIRTALAAADPEDTMSRIGLGDTYNYIGGIFHLKGDLPQAVEYFKKAFTVRTALFQKDPANERFRFAVGESKRNIGGIYREMAMQKHSDAGKQLALCRESISWLQQALPVFLQRKAEGMLEGADFDEVEQIPRNIETCREIIGRLGGPPGS